MMVPIFSTTVKSSRAKGIDGSIDLLIEVYSVSFTAEELIVKYAIFLPGAARYNVKEGEFRLPSSDPRSASLDPIKAGIDQAFKAMSPSLIED